MSTDTVFGFVAIGIAASLAGMIWPFQRGTLGIVVNLAVGVLGAVLGGFASYAVLPWANHRETPARLFFSALGALAALFIVHATWVRVADSIRTRRASTPPPVR
ncbi:MAG: hypothetical protein M3O50_10915 [Myxococcota bacterium]|nr:hypothetical protein [Myxococcota bacterium]